MKKMYTILYFCGLLLVSLINSYMTLHAQDPADNLINTESSPAVSANIDASVASEVVPQPIASKVTAFPVPTTAPPSNNKKVFTKPLVETQQNTAPFAVRQKNEIIPKESPTDNKVIQNRIGTQLLKEGARKLLDLYIKSDPHLREVARVRTGNGLCDGEKKFIATRQPSIRMALAALTGKPVNKTPTIAIVASGGGYRAMLATMGFLNGLNKIHILNTAMYMVGLSGSTWALSYLLVNGKPLQEAVNSITMVATQGITNFKQQDINQIVKGIATKWVYDQPISLVDLYGAALADALFTSLGAQAQQIRLSDQSKIIASGKYPMPIYTAIRADDPKAMWWEFTPYEVGATWLRNYVPTWAFGRKFANGISIQFAPEQSLGYMLGLFGSAYAATLGQIYEHGIENRITNPILKQLFQNYFQDKANIRLLVPQVFNFTAGMASSPLKNTPLLSLVDAGSHPGFGLPYPPISGETPERTADVIILLDASNHVENRDPLGKIAVYAQQHNLLLPPMMNRELAYQKPVSVFVDKQNEKTPVVIYISLVQSKALWDELKDKPEYIAYSELSTFDLAQCMKGSCRTANFVYTRSDALGLTQLAEFNVVSHAQIIKDAVLQKVR